MQKYNVKIGLVPLRRDCTARPGTFNWEFAEARGREIVQYIKEHYTTENVSFVDLKGVIDVEVLWSTNDVDKVVKHFNDNGVDSIVLICANFGNEEAAGYLSKKMGKPVLLWAPQDDTFYEDGMRMTDSQCGSFGIARMLHRMNVTFSFINSCFVDDKKFEDGLMKFAKVTCAVRNFMGMKIGQIGLRPQPFSSVIFNEGQLMEEFDTHVVPLNLALIQTRYNQILQDRKEELKKGADDLRAKYILDKVSDEGAEKLYAFVLLFKDLMDEKDLDGISAECWSAMPALVGSKQCVAYAILSDMGYLSSCESDMHAIMTQLLLRSLTFGKKVPFLGEFTVRHPSNRNAELLWHCGQFPYSMHKETMPCKVNGLCENFCGKDGHYTVARIDQDHGKYSIIFDECDTVEGPYTHGTYIWGEFKDLDKFERMLIEGAYIHHVSEIEGSLSEEIKEVCKYIPALKANPVN